MTTTNGFTFDTYGALVGEPEGYTLQDLRNTYDVLILAREYISASRINHLMNVWLQN